MAISLKFRDMIPQWAIDELDQLVSAIRAFLITPTGEHNNDGSHADITANSITFPPILDDGLQPPQIVWNSPNGPLQIAGYDNSQFGHVIDILAERKTTAGNQLNFVNIKAFSTPQGLTPAFSTLTVLATHVSGAPFRFIQMDSDKVQLTTNTKLNLDIGAIFEGTRTTGLGMWLAYTPVEDSMVNALGNGVLTGRYTLIGKTVHFWARLTVGSTTTFTGNLLRLSLPVAATGSTFAEHLTAMVYDASTTQIYTAQGLLFDTTRVFASRSADDSIITSANPVASAQDDQYVISGSYETT